MTDEPDVILRDMLRTRLTDPNPSRVAGTPYVTDNWPYQTDLTYNHFPRISVINQFENNLPFGLGSTDSFDTYRLQIDIWVKPDNLVTISASPYEGFEEIRKISRDVTEAIRLNWITDLANTNKFIIRGSLDWYKPKRDYDFNLVRRTGDVTFKWIRV